MDKYYVGLDDYGHGKVFATTDPEDATPENSGFTDVIGPFDTGEEAEENCP